MKIVIDGSYIAFRTYHKSPPLTNSAGVPTSVIHGVMQSIITLINKYGRENVAVVFDAKGKNRRHEIHPEYKATRDATPEDLGVQFGIMDELIPLLGVAYYKVDGYEGDDIMATIAAHTKDDVGMLTKDKDLYQIVDDRVKIYDSQKGEFFGRDMVIEKFGVPPEKVRELLALAGDTADNIPGVAGVGVKTAAKLLNEHGSLDGIYENIESVKGKLKDKLIDNKDSAYLSYDLVGLDILESIPDVEIVKDDKKLSEKLTELELKTIQSKLFADSGSEDVQPDVKAVEAGDVSDVHTAVFLDGKIYVTDGEKYCEYDGHNLKSAQFFYDIKGIYRLIGERYEEAYDVFLMSWLNDPDSGGITKSKAENIEQFIGNIVVHAQEEKDKLKANGLLEVYLGMELPVAYCLGKMENNGIGFDKDVMAKVADKLQDEVAEISEKIKTFVGYDINLNSPKQLQVFLFEELGVEGLKKTKTGFSTDEESLRAMIPMNPLYAHVLEDILVYRELAKLLSTYALPLKDYVLADGRIHSSFRQTGTATGRLSSVNPNMQNIPMKGKWGVKLREAFIPREGYSFVSFDYSQIELRILAHLTGDEHLKEAYRNNEDIHTKTASGIFGVAPEKVDSGMRRLAKAVNFGILYGLSPFGLSRDTGVSQKEAKKFMEKYFATYPEVKGFIEKIAKETKEKGYAETLAGRKRFIREIRSKNRTVAMRGERIATNVPMQGSAADIIKLAMVECQAVLDDKEYDALVVLQVHDELVFEVLDKDIDAFSDRVRSIMEGVMELDVPLVVNGAAGKNLGELK
ncbi:DNA polymerase [Deferribacteres bacterium DY0037]